MKTYFTADTHFGHARIIELCNRPFSSVADMNDQLVSNINETVDETDRIVILGDICMGKLENSLPLLTQLRAGEIVLIPGNHDRWSYAYDYRGDVEKKRLDAMNRYSNVDPRIVTLPDRAPSVFGFGEINDAADWEHPLRQVWFSHYPYEGDSHGEDRHTHLRPPVNYLDRPIIHGHVHTEWHTRGRQYNVGVDVNNYYPVSEDTLTDWVATL